MKRPKSIFLPSTHSLSTLVSRVALLRHTENEANIRIPTNRNFPAFFWILQPSLNNSFWNRALSQSAALLPLAFPWNLIRLEISKIIMITLVDKTVHCWKKTYFSLIWGTLQKCKKNLVCRIKHVKVH